MKRFFLILTFILFAIPLSSFAQNDSIAESDEFENTSDADFEKKATDTQKQKR